MTLGQNTIESAALRGIVEEIELIESEMQEMRDKKGEIFARAKSNGFATAGIRYVVKARKMKPHDRQEAETIRDIYMHAMGMDEEPPLFRAVAAMAQDDLSREKLIESLKAMCPPKGEFIAKLGGEQFRVFRDAKGEARAEPYIDPAKHSAERAASPSAMKGNRPPREVPDVDDDGAEDYGRQMYRDNRPITENPFPFGDTRRARCDEGFRKESGGDGMGPDD
jgi:uncharacterized protein (UPF0335 family)